MMEYIAALDMRILESLYAARDLNVAYSAIWLSELGRAWTIYGLAVCIALALFLRQHYAYATGLAISVATSGVAILLLKGLAQRPRPPEHFQAYLEIWYSFPSAHAALAMAFYGFLAYLAWRSLGQTPLRYLAVSSLFLLILLVSFTRIYLGVHWASDVVAGLVLGTVCAWLGVRWVRFAQRS